MLLDDPRNACATDGLRAWWKIGARDEKQPSSGGKP
jgi:hypothetical protein